MKKAIIATVLLVLVLTGVHLLVKDQLKNTSTKIFANSDPKNASYMIDGQTFALVNGRDEVAIANSASAVITQYFGDEVTADLNGDGLPDKVVILTQSTGGSGTSYYVAVAVNTPDGYKGTNAVLLGDRIAPQNIEVQNGKITVNFADRNPGEPMSTQPSMGVSKSFVLSGDQLMPTSQ